MCCAVSVNIFGKSKKIGKRKYFSAKAKSVKANNFIKGMIKKHPEQLPIRTSKRPLKEQKDQRERDAFLEKLKKDEGLEKRLVDIYNEMVPDWGFGVRVHRRCYIL